MSEQSHEYYQRLLTLAKRRNIDEHMDHIIQDTAHLLCMDSEMAAHLMYNLLLLCYPNDSSLQASCVSNEKKDDGGNQ